MLKTEYRRNRLTRALLALLAFALAAPLHAQQVADRLAALQLDVAYLSSDLMEGREAGTRGEALAAQYIASRFDDLGLEPAFDDWTQEFTFEKRAHPHTTDGERRTARNVAGWLDFGADATIVIGAHYDHLGYGGIGSLQPGDSLIHNGADDNASGVAALFDIAALFRSSLTRSANVLFVAFSAEEQGLIGSKHFVAELPVPRESVRYMINLDMVGRLGADRRLVVNGTGTSPAWPSALEEASGSLSLVSHESGLAPSDHASFYLADIPVLHLFTGQHAEYHKPADDSHLVDYEGLLDVSAFTVRLIEALDGQDLAFTKTKDEQRAAASFKVSLGIMPDYVFEGPGVRVDAVLDGRAAEAAGMEQGDIIIRMGDRAIDDVYDYMESLASFEEGAETAVRVRRGDGSVTLTVRF